MSDNEKGKHFPVRGHSCAGLKDHHEYAYYGCIPRINSGGMIVGCDDSNEVRITFCPFCGEKLSEAE